MERSLGRYLLLLRCHRHFGIQSEMYLGLVEDSLKAEDQGDFKFLTQALFCLSLDITPSPDLINRSSDREVKVIGQH